MPILFSDVTVVPMDGAPQVLEHAYVAVEGTKIASVGTEPPEGTFDRVVDATCTPGSTSISFLPRRAWTAGRWRQGPGWAWRR